MWEEFKKFIDRGNVIELAVGIVIGGAFGKIVSSFVDDILMPPIGLIVGKVDFSNLYINLTGSQSLSLNAAKKAGDVTINYGSFLNVVVNFLIIAFAIFLVLRQVNKFSLLKKEEPATTKECPACLTEIPLHATRCPNCTTYLEDEEDRETEPTN
ncbi:large-conductance mechanosensitive channel protein MscL [Bacillus testis]|uniref:large-conductance mechanosensitive channel protein MscL n=1 Tax=Bacillus testis TaxID=1622072 RepID=UPI00067EA352|nr:large-conductance mechanosensitive channel protein MscL [Bacillus testis]